MKMGGGKILKHSAAEPHPRQKQKKHHRWTQMNTDFTEANRKRRRACRAEKLGNKTLPQRRGDRQRNAGMAGESQPGWIATKEHKDHKRKMREKSFSAERQRAQRSEAATECRKS